MHTPITITYESNVKYREFPTYVGPDTYVVFDTYIHVVVKHAVRWRFIMLSCTLDYSFLFVSVNTYLVALVPNLETALLIAFLNVYSPPLGYTSTPDGVIDYLRT